MNEELKTYLQLEFGQKYSVLAGRANVLLFSIFKSFPVGSKIIFPAMMCPSPLIVAKHAGMQPVLCDVSLHDGLLDAELVMKMVSEDASIKAVLSVNLYGQRPLNEKMHTFLRSKNVLLIEDTAQGWNPDQIGRDVDVTVFSFGSKKTVDCGAGGLLLTNDQKLIDGVKREMSLISYTNKDRMKELSGLYSKLYYLLQEWEEKDPGAQKQFIHFQDLLKDLYFPDPNVFDEALIFEGIKSYKKNFKDRYSWAKRYEETLKGNPLFSLFMKLEPSSGPWRYSFIYNGKDHDQFVDHLRANKVDVSCWYPSLDKLGFNTHGRILKNSLEFGIKVINLWVSEMSEEKFAATINAIENFKES